MGQDPGEIRQDIERTREQMGDTVEALSYKADVKARAKDSVTDRVDSVKSRVGLAGSKVSDAAPSGDDVKQGARRAKGIAEENPLGLAIGAVAVGFVAGLAVRRRASRTNVSVRWPTRSRTSEGDRSGGARARQGGRPPDSAQRQGDRSAGRPGARGGAQGERYAGRQGSGAQLLTPAAIQQGTHRGRHRAGRSERIDVDGDTRRTPGLLGWAGSSSSSCPRCTAAR